MKLLTERTMRTMQVLLLPLILTSPLGAQSYSSPSSSRGGGPGTQTISAGAHYQAGGLHRWLWGSNYRDLWTTPIPVAVLDLEHYAGGLRAVQKGGGRQTKSLRLVAGDGREFFFRSVDKNGLAILAPELQASVVGRIWQDEVSAFLPGGALVVAPLLRSVGVRTLHPHLYVLPDDPALDEFREAFRGELGMLEERPTASLVGAKELLPTDKMLERIQQDPSQQVDSRAFLASRLMDMYIGDADRGMSQWFWLRYNDTRQVAWEPLGIDRDYAFVSYGGLMVDLVRHRFPKLVDYKGHYPDLIGLNWRASSLDRRLLGALPAAAWDSVARALAGKLSDSAIDSSVQRLPSPFYAAVGGRLAQTLRQRRDQLPEAAMRFYRLIALDAQVYGTQQNEVVSATRGPGGVLDLAIRPSNTSTPYYSRQFRSGETKEVRLFLSGGEDTVVVAGTGSGPGLRILGDSGAKVVTNNAGGSWVRLYAPHPVAAVVGRGSRDVSVKTKPYREPDSTSSVRPAPRDWGHWWWYSFWFRYDADRGAMIGATTTLFNYGFRKNPYASRFDAFGGYGTEAGRFGGAVSLDLRRENSTTHWLFRAGASGADVRHFYGFGNETEQVQGKPFYKVFGDAYEVSAAVAWGLTRRASARVGPLVRYTSTDFSRSPFISEARPYGSGEFGEFGGQLGLDFDTRDVPAAATRGAHLALDATLYPPVWDVDSTFGDLHAEASTYLTAPISFRPTLALRAGGRKVWGGFPYQDAAFIGGSSTVRGLSSHRFLGDASAYGNAELRLPLSHLNLLAPVELGIFGLADAGRVWVTAESSSTWHSAFGGGLSLAFLNNANTVTAAIAHGDQQTSVYLGSGFMF
jgi:hypothetical protein